MTRHFAAYPQAIVCTIVVQLKKRKLNDEVQHPCPIIPPEAAVRHSSAAPVN